MNKIELPFEIEYDYLNKVEKLKGKSKDESYKLLWGWTKDTGFSDFGFKLFKALCQYIEKM